MSSVMLVAVLATTIDRPTPQFAAGRLLLDALPEANGFNFEDPEGQVDRLLPDLDPQAPVFDENDELLLPIAKQMGHKIIDALEASLSSDEVTTLDVAGYYLFLTGGMSYGDAPSDTAQALWDAASLPAYVLKVMGFIPEFSKPVSRANGSQGKPTDTDVLDALSLGLGTKPRWDGADTLEWVANTISRVRPHPGDANPAEYLRDFRDTHNGFDPLQDPFLEGEIDTDDLDDDEQ